MSEISQLVTIKVMDALMQRQTAIAHNVANAGSRVYARKVVDFEGALRAAFAQGPEALRAFAPQMTSFGPVQSGGEIRLDLEMQSASANALRFAAVSDVLGRQMSLAFAAVRGGQ